MRLTIIIVVVIAAMFVGGGIYVASGLRSKIEDKLIADQALVDGPPRPQLQLPSAEPPAAESSPEQPVADEPPTVPQAAVLIQTLSIMDFHVQQGTGFFVSADGRLITSDGVVNGSVVLSVALQDGTPLIAAVVKQDQEYRLTELQVGVSGDVPFLEITAEQPEEGAKVWIVTVDGLIPGTVGQPESTPDMGECVKVQTEGLQNNARGAAVVDRQGNVWGIVQGVQPIDEQTALVRFIGSRP